MKVSVSHLLTGTAINIRSWLVFFVVFLLLLLFFYLIIFVKNKQKFNKVNKNNL